ncbi:MAG: M24 family metallopeptidase [Deferrisomatales bacterium]
MEPADADPGARRRARLRLLLAAERLDAVLVPDPHSLRYLTGFTGSNGLLLVDEDRATLYTDSRYTLQAREQAPTLGVVEAPDLDRAAAAALAGSGYVGLQAQSVTAARWQRLARRLGDADLVDLGGAVDGLRAQKDAREARRLRAAAALAEAALAATLPRLVPGATEAEVAREFHLEVLRRGAEDLSFDTIVAGGPRGALPHARPGDRPFREGDLVVFDFGVRLDGYCSDETVTVPVGRVGGEAREVYDLVLAAQRAALDALVPGVPLAQVDRAAREVIGAAGHADHFGHGTGHGVGLAVHEAPTVSSRSDDLAREGMVLTVEPGVYLADRFGVRLEDTVLVTATGWERITSVPKEFGAVWEWAR